MERHIPLDKKCQYYQDVISVQINLEINTKQITVLRLFKN